MKVVKWFFGIALVLVISLAVYLTMIFDPNDFKPEIVNAVKKQTGRDLVISKDLTWTFFPKLGINFGGITLSNPKGFKPREMLQIEQATAEVALMPLFSKKIEVSTLKLDGLTINLVTKKNGRSSLDGISGSAGKFAKTDTSASTKTLPVNIASLNIGGISITNSQINIIDEMKGERQQFNLDRLTLGRFSLGQFAPFSFKASAKIPNMTLVSEGQGKLSVAADLQSIKLRGLKIENTIEGRSIPNKKIQINLVTQIDIFLDKQQLKLQLDALSVDAMKATGNLGINYGSKIPRVTGQIDFGDLDLDALLPEKQQAPSAKRSAKEIETEPDLTGLKQLDIKLSLTAKSIKVASIRTQNWLMNTTIKNGVLKISKLTAQLYQGKLNASGQLDARQKIARYRFSKNLEAIQIRPLLKDAADVEVLSGTANFTISGTGRSLIIDNIKRNLVAKGSFEVADGSVYGVNIPYMVRSAQAKLQGKFAKESLQEKKTDFTKLTGSFNVLKGLVSNPDLRMASPLVRLRGAGSAHLITKALDYKLTARVVGSLKGQGTEQDKLKGFDVPVAITGTINKPKFSLDTSGLVDAKLKQEKEKIKDKLKEMFFEKLRSF